MTRMLIVAAASCLSLTMLGASCSTGGGGYYDRHDRNDRGPYVDRHDGARDGWDLLGRTTVDSRRGVDNDVIRLGKSAGRFKRLDFRVDGGDIELYNVRVVYHNGDTRDINFRHMFDRRGRTRSHDLEGDERTLREVQFSYRAV